MAINRKEVIRLLDEAIRLGSMLNRELSVIGTILENSHEAGQKQKCKWEGQVRSH